MIASRLKGNNQYYFYLIYLSSATITVFRRLSSVCMQLWPQRLYLSTIDY